MTKKQRLSPLSPPLEMIREAVRRELQANPLKISALEFSKLPDMKQWFRLDECAGIFAVSNSQVRNWIDEGLLDARAISSGIDPQDAPGKRVDKRVTRESIVRLLNAKSRSVAGV